METVTLDPGSKIRDFVKASFPSYRKKKVFLHIHPEASKEIKTNPGGWDSGSIDYDYVVEVSGPQPDCKKTNQATLFNFDRELGFPKVLIDDTKCMATDGVYSSKPATIYINCTQKFYNTHLKD